MKQILSLVLPLLLLMGGISSHAQDCNATDVAYFEQHLYPVFEDYTALRYKSLAQRHLGKAGGELLKRRAQLDTALEDSPACLNGFALDLVLSMANMQAGLLFLILSFEVDEPALAERFQQIGLYYGAQSDEQYTAAAETVTGWNGKSLIIEGDQGTESCVACMGCSICTISHVGAGSMVRDGRGARDVG